MEVMRTTVKLPAELHAALKRRASDEATTMGALVCVGLRAGLRAPVNLAAASTPHRRSTGSRRTTVDLPRDLHRTLKLLAIEHETTVHALILAVVVGLVRSAELLAHDSREMNTGAGL